MARSRAVALQTPANRAQVVDAEVNSRVRRITQAMSTHSRTMLAATSSTPFDANRPNRDMPIVGTLGPQSTGYYLPPLTRFSRHLDRNDGLIRRGLDIRADATVGTGPWPEFEFQTLNDLFEEWMNECDRRDKLSFGQIIWKSERAKYSGGESFIQIFAEPLSSERVVPLSIKGIELDHVDCYDNRINADTGNRIISGIEIDDDDKTVAIWVLPYHPHDMHIMSRWKPSIRIPIADILHLYDESEFSSLRGIPLIAPAIVKAIQTMKFENATAARMIASTLFTHWATQTDRAAGGAKLPGEQDMDDWVSEILMEPGAFNVLPFGIKVDQSLPPETGGTYEPYIKGAHRYAAAVMGVLYQEMTGDWENATDRTHRAATLPISRAIDRDRLNIETKELRPLAHRFVDAAYLSGRWLPPEGVPQRQWYRHVWKWPAKRYQNLFQEFNAFSLAIEKDLMDRDTAIGELFGLDARKVDRAQAKAKARKAALEVGEAGEIIRTEIAADELEVAKAFALSDDDAAGLRAPTKPTTRSDKRAARKR